MSTPYTDTFILECNRRHSAQYPNEEDTSLWTNQVNDGLKLNVGDQVSVHSAMISNLGAEDATIEFKGKDIVPIGEQSYTESVLTEPELNDINNMEQIQRDNLETTLQLYTNTTTTNTLPIPDNQAKLSLNYYKNANGEYMLCLPSQWGWDGGNASSTNGGYNINAGRRNQNVSGTTIKLNKDQLSGYGQVAVSPSLDRRCFNDWTSRDGRYCNDQYKDTLTATTPGYAAHINTFRTQTKCDNSRFQLFVKTKTRFIELNTAAGNASLEQSIRDIAVRDPALYEYIPFQQLLDIEVPIGFNSPSEISEQITQTLNALQDTDDISFYYDSANKNTRAPPPYMPENTFTQMKQVVSKKQVTNTYKLFNAFTAKDHAKSNASAFFGQTSTPTSQFVGHAKSIINLEASTFYLRNYQFIGFKRPDFVQLGREVATLQPSTYNSAASQDLSEVRKCLDSSGWIDGRSDDYPGWRQNAYTYDYTTIVTNIEWTEPNVKKYHNWFVSQGNYPELFELQDTNIYKFQNTGLGGDARQYRGNASDISIDTHRFVHLNRFDDGSMPENRFSASTSIGLPALSAGTDTYSDGQKCFGYDGYQTSDVYASGTSDLTDYTSVPLFIYYNPLDKDYTNFAKAGNFSRIDAPPNKRFMYGGTMLRGLDRKTGKFDRIAFLAQVPDQYCTLTNGSGAVVTYPANASSKWLAGYNNEDGYAGPNYDIRRIGYDKHFSAYGNSAIGLWNGHVDDKGTDKTFNSEHKIITNFGAITGSNPVELLRQIYVGSNEPLFNFDTTKSRFEISQLHCAEREGNPSGAGVVSETSDWQGTEVPDSLLGKEVYKINKRLTESNFTPSMMPYTPPVADWVPKYNPANASGINILPDLNPFLETMVVYDSHSGLLIKDWGIPKKYWVESIWGVMGFTYRQLNPQADGITGNINTRITSTTDNDIAYITTNADFVSADSLALTANSLGNQLYNPTIITPQFHVNSNYPFNPIPGQPDLGTLQYFNTAPFTIVTSSATISAANLPTKTLRPYYTIRSDILTDSYYFGGVQQGTILPVISVVDKMNQYGDFFYKQSSELVFNVTNPLTITSITTAICDPDGEPAVLSPNSCVLYKIVKNNNARSDIIQQIAQQAQQNNK